VTVAIRKHCAASYLERKSAQWLACQAVVAALAICSSLTPDPGIQIICIPALSGWLATSQSAQHSDQESQTLRPHVHVDRLPIMQRLQFHRSLRRIPNVLLRECQAPEHEADISPPTTADIKNEWSCTSSPPICLYGACRDNFKFYTLSGLFYGTELAKNYSKCSNIVVHLTNEPSSVSYSLRTTCPAHRNPLLVELF